MANPSNVIELIFRMKDQITGPLNTLKGKIGGLAAFGLAAAGVASFGAVILKTIHASREAEDVLTKFDLAFKNIGATSGKTRDELVKFADDASKITIFDDEKILEATTALLRFKSVTGDTFDRARQDAIDLASAMGTDLASAAQLVGRAIERPEIAIRQLRAAGVTFTADQEKMIKALVKTGDKAGAANVVLLELERRFKGAGAVAAGTLSGALARLKTAFDNLFEVKTDNVTRGVSALADALNDPSVKEGIQTLLGGLIEVVAIAAKAIPYLVKFGKAVADIFVSSTAPGATAVLKKELESAEVTLRFFENRGMTEQVAQQKAYNDTLRQRIALSQQLDSMAARRRAVSRANGEMNKAHPGGSAPAGAGGAGGVVDPELVKRGKELTEGLRTASEKYAASVAEADKLLASHAITFETYLRVVVKARDEMEGLSRGVLEVTQRFEELNPTIEQALEKFRKQNAGEIDEATKKLGEGLEKLPIDVRTAFDKVYATVSDTLERMLNNGKFTWREFGQYLLREVIAGSIKKALDALKKAIAGAMKPSSTSGGGSGGILGKIIDTVGGIFTSGRAGGGRIPRGGAWVGENGPEWIDEPGAMVRNGSMLAGMGRGASITYAPVSQYTLSNPDDKQAQALVQLIELRSAQNQKEFLRVLERNGLRRPR